MSVPNFRCNKYPCYNLSIALVIVILLTDPPNISPAQPSAVFLAVEAKSTPDIGFCEAIRSKQTISLDCFSGEKTFCCDDEEVTLWNNVTKWSKKCCTESEYVLQNA